MTVKPPPPAHCHGTWEGWEVYGCGCTPCRHAWSVFRKTYHDISVAFDKAYEPIMAETGFNDILDLAIRYRMALA